jgi:hypothetical protein
MVSAAKPATPAGTMTLRNLAILLVVAAVSAFLQFHRLSDWPWDHDEVYALAELGLRESPVDSAPTTQLTRMPRLLPAWAAAQGAFLRVLPHNEWGTRVLPALCGVAGVVLAFLVGWRARGLAFALALVCLLDGSQFLVWMAQYNRFYTFAMLFVVLALTAIWARTFSPLLAVLTAVLTAMAVLSHNLLVVVFGLAFVSASAGFVFGFVPRPVVLRSGIAAGVSALLYVFYLRPIMQGWVSGGTGGTNVLVSFVAQVGIPTLALAGFGTAAALASSEGRQALGWWVLLLAGSLLFIACSPLYLPSWNPRYGILFMAPVWVLAAYAVEFIGRRMPSRALTVAVYGLVALLLLPKLASHYQDGSRHDFRQAAGIVKASARGENTVLCNWPETLEYYLPGSTGLTVHNWEIGRPVPPETCLIVESSNAWLPPVRLSGRSVELLAQVSKRRFDEQSHVISIYRVGPAPTAAEAQPSALVMPPDGSRP